MMQQLLLALLALGSHVDAIGVPTDSQLRLDLDGVDVSASHRALTSLTPEMGYIFADFKRALAEEDEDGADKELSRAKALGAVWRGLTGQAPALAAHLGLPELAALGSSDAHCGGRVPLDASALSRARREFELGVAGGKAPEALFSDALHLGLDLCGFPSSRRRVQEAEVETYEPTTLTPAPTTVTYSPTTETYAPSASKAIITYAVDMSAGADVGDLVAAIPAYKQMVANLAGPSVTTDQITIQFELVSAPTNRRLDEVPTDPAPEGYVWVMIAKILLDTQEVGKIFELLEKTTAEQVAVAWVDVQAIPEFVEATEGQVFVAIEEVAVDDTTTEEGLVDETAPPTPATESPTPSPSAGPTPAPSAGPTPTPSAGPCVDINH